MKKMMLWMGVMAAVAMVPVAGAALVAVDDFDFVYGSDTVTVHSEVDLDNGIYTYSYKIISTDIHVFNIAIGLLPGSSVDAGSVNTWLDGGVIPSSWEISDSPLLASAMFGTLVNPGAVSDTIYFESTQAPTIGSGLVSGMTQNLSFVGIDGQVFTPIPEPATLALLAVGMGVVLRRRKSC